MHSDREVFWVGPWIILSRRLPEEEFAPEKVHLHLESPPSPEAWKSSFYLSRALSPGPPSPANPQESSPLKAHVMILGLGMIWFYFQCWTYRLQGHMINFSVRQCYSNGLHQPSGRNQIADIPLSGYPYSQIPFLQPTPQRV